MAPPENDGRGKKELEEKSNVVSSNVADSDSDSDSDSDHDYGLYVDGRPMSRKLRDEYNRQVDESEGVRMVAPINPQRGFENIPRYTELSRMAIDDFNSQNNKKYEFVKNLTVNVSLAAGLWCRITFQARDADDATTDALKTFQTSAWWGFNGDRRIRFCRLKKPSVVKEKSSNVVSSNVADSDHDYGMYVDGRPMSWKLRDEYNRQADESEGFEINLGLPLEVSVVGHINPQWGFENIPRYTELSRMAIANFISQNNKRYEFVKNLIVNTSLAAGYWCRITFQARDADADAVKTFQTLAWWGFDGDKEITFCTLKKQSSGEGGERPPESNVDVKATQ